MSNTNKKTSEFKEKIQIIKNHLENNEVKEALNCYCSINNSNINYAPLKLFYLFYKDPTTFNISKNIYAYIMKSKSISKQNKEILTFFMSIKGLYIGKYDYFLSKEDTLSKSHYQDYYNLFKAKHLTYSKNYDLAHNILDKLYLRENRDEYLSSLAVLYTATNNFDEAKRRLEKFKNKDCLFYWQELFSLSVRVGDLDAAYHQSTHLLSEYKTFDSIRAIYKLNHNLALELGKPYLFDDEYSSESIIKNSSTEAKITHVLKHESGKSNSIFAKDYKIEENLERLLDKSKIAKPFNYSFYDTYLFDEGKTIGTVCGIDTSKIVVVTDINSSNIDNIVTAYPALSYYNSEKALKKQSVVLKQKIKV